MKESRVSRRSIPLFLVVSLAIVDGSYGQGQSSDESGSLLKRLGLSGRAYLNTSHRVKEPDVGTPLQTVGSIWVKTDGEFSDRWKWHGVFNWDHFARESGATTYRYKERRTIREAYLDYQSVSGFQIQSGKKIIPWGNADGVNPTDFLTAKDFTLFNQDDEVRRQGAELVRVAFTPMSGDSPLLFEMIAQARAPRSRLLTPQSVLSPSGNISVQNEADESAAWFGNQSELAFKTSYLASSFDLSVSAFRGRTHLPVLFLENVTTIRARYPKLWALGMEGSFTRDAWVFRLEQAYLHPESFQGYREVIQPPHWDAVIGAERRIYSDFRVQVQMLSRRHFRNPTPALAQGSNPIETALLRQIGSANELLLNYRDPWLLGGSFRLSHEVEGSSWTKSATLLGYHRGVGYLFRPNLTYKGVENLKIGAALDLYGGPKDGSLGVLRSFSQASLQLDYDF